MCAAFGLLRAAPLGLQALELFRRHRAMVLRIAVDRHPEHRPDDPEHAGDDEGDPPAEAADQPGDQGQGQCRADPRAAVEDAGGDATLAAWKPVGGDFGARGIGARLAHAQQQPAAQQCRDAVRDGGEAGEHRPPDDGETQGDARADPVGEPAERHLHDGIGPEEGAQDQPDHGGVDAQLARMVGAATARLARSM